MPLASTEADWTMSGAGAILQLPNHAQTPFPSLLSETGGCAWLREEDLGLPACLPSGAALCPLRGAAMRLPGLAVRSPWAPGSWEAEVGEN